ncbi:ankyrin repeats (3 copies) domain-containing protein [Ditylenchus destructor]|nr:ankyrin repeats (3 copies) domain-containing protein [Ditylenchus destructor]
MKDPTFETLDQLLKARTVRQFVDILGVQIYARNADAEDFSLDMMKDIGFSKDDACKIYQACAQLKNSTNVSPHRPNTMRMGKILHVSYWKNKLNLRNKPSSSHVSFGSQTEHIFTANDSRITFMETMKKMSFESGPNYSATLFTAAAMGDLKRMEAIIRIQYNSNNVVHMKNNRGWTPLMYAGQGGHGDVCQLLLQCGAHWGAINDKRRTAMILSVSWGHPKVTELLIRHAKANSNCKSEYYQYINMSDIDGRTALHHAILASQLKCVEILVQNGANPTLMDNESKTAIALAKELNRSDALDELLKCKK